MTPAEIAFALTAACPTCAEQPGDPCRQWPELIILAEPHSTRYDSAQFIQAIKGYNRTADQQPLTDAEIETTGLV